MSDENYVVPEEGLKAAMDAAVDYLNRNKSVEMDLPMILMVAIEKGFILWQDEKLEKMNRRMDTGTEAEKEIYRAGWEHGIDDVRRIYLAPEREDKG
jgi:hypothetical protein